MENIRQCHGEQVALWNGPAGRAWVETQVLLDQILQPFEDLLIGTALAEPATRVLDVGCGTGSTTLAAARRLGGQGACVGIDISEPMIAAARARADRDRLPASFLCDDAQTHAFEPAGFDRIISRFGVMFFDDPVRAFANLRQAATEGAGLCFIAWRGAEENSFMTTAERAAAPWLPDLPARQPGAPGQFAFAVPHHIRRILEESGWGRIEIRPVDAVCAMPESELVGYLTRLGPVGLALQEKDEPTRARIIEAIRPAFDPYVHGGEVRFTAACWMVSA